MTRFYDHFSGHAELYNRHRPRYPDELYAWLVDQVDGRDVALDCATGGGQAAVGLAEHFGRVIGIDASVRQLANAARRDNIEYMRMSAERLALADDSVDVLTVAQALHWLDLGVFFAEAGRVVRPGGLVAAWMYQLFSIDDDVDPVVRSIYHDVLDPYWPPQRAHVRNNYSDFELPFDEITAPELVMTPSWTRDDLLNQVATWSAVRRHDADTDSSAVAMLEDRLEEVWPDPAEERALEWRITLRAGRVGS